MTVIFAFLPFKLNFSDDFWWKSCQNWQFMVKKLPKVGNNGQKNELNTARVWKWLLKINLCKYLANFAIKFDFCHIFYYIFRPSLTHIHIHILVFITTFFEQVYQLYNKVEKPVPTTSTYREKLKSIYNFVEIRQLCVMGLPTIHHLSE